MPEVQPVVVHESQCEEERWEPPAPGTVRWRTLLSADRTPTSALTVGVAEIAPGGEDRLRLHRHGPPEIYYVVAGEGRVSIDGAEHEVRAGSAVFVPGDAWHAVRNTGSQPLRLLYTFPVDAFADVEYVFADPEG